MPLWLAASLLTVGLLTVLASVALLLWGGDRKAVGEAIGVLAAFGGSLIAVGLVGMGFGGDTVDPFRP